MAQKRTKLLKTLTAVSLVAPLPVASWADAQASLAPMQPAGIQDAASQDDLRDIAALFDYDLSDV